MPRAAQPFRIVDAQFVTGQLAVGADLDTDNPSRAQAQLDELAHTGITHIVDVRIEWNDELFVRSHAPAIQYLHHGVDDAGQRIPGTWFERLTTWSLAALDEPDAKLYVHCHMGVNRGPSAAFAILLAQGWEPLPALNAIRGVRPTAFIAYAENALAWHQRRNRLPKTMRREQRVALAGWRRGNDLDLEAVIRAVRLREAAAWGMNDVGEGD